LQVDTILRGTLRFEGFCHVMEAMRKLGMFDETASAALAPGAAAISWGEFVSGMLSKASAGGSGGSGPHEVRDQMKAFLAADGNTADEEDYTMSTFERPVIDRQSTPTVGHSLDFVSSSARADGPHGGVTHRTCRRADKLE